MPNLGETLIILGGTVMTVVERIRGICKERKIPISRLERECGFANGYIGQLKKGTLPHDRLMRIADYLEVSPNYLATGEEGGAPYISDEVREIAQFLMENEDLRILFDTTKKVKKEDIGLIQAMAEKLSQN